MPPCRTARPARADITGLPVVTLALRFHQRSFRRDDHRRRRLAAYRQNHGPPAPPPAHAGFNRLRYDLPSAFARKIACAPGTGHPYYRFSGARARCCEAIRGAPLLSVHGQTVCRAISASRPSSSPSSSWNRHRFQVLARLEPWRLQPTRSRYQVTARGESCAAHVLCIVGARRRSRSVPTPWTRTRSKSSRSLAGITSPARPGSRPDIILIESAEKSTIISNLQPPRPALASH